MSLVEKIKESLEEVIIFLKGEDEENKDKQLYTDEEMRELYGIKKDIQKFPKKSDDDY